MPSCAGPTRNAVFAAMPSWFDVTGTVIDAPGISDGWSTCARRYATSASTRTLALDRRSQPPTPFAVKPWRMTSSLVNVVVGVETLNRSLPAAKAENDKRVQAVVQAMRALGVVSKDIQTDYIQVHPEYVTRNDTITILRHYTVRKTIAVTLRDVTKFERALSDALESGANHILNLIDQLAHARYQAPGLIQMTLQEIAK